MRNQENSQYADVVVEYHKAGRRSQYPDYRNQINNSTS